MALFTLNFDPSRLSNPEVALAEGLPEGARLTLNTAQASDGKVSILIDSPTPFVAGLSIQLVTVTFDVRKDSSAGETPITFGSGSLSDSEARSLDAIYQDGSIKIGGRSVVYGFTAPFRYEAFFRLMGR